MGEYPDTPEASGFGNKIRPYERIPTLLPVGGRIGPPLHFFHSDLSTSRLSDLLTFCYSHSALTVPLSGIDDFVVGYCFADHRDSFPNIRD